MELNRQMIFDLLEKIRNESGISRRVELLRAINILLPSTMKLKIPSLITNDYIDFAIYKIEGQLLMA